MPRPPARSKRESAAPNGLMTRGQVGENRRGRTEGHRTPTLAQFSLFF